MWVCGCVGGCLCARAIVNAALCASVCLCSGAHVRACVRVCESEFACMPLCERVRVHVRVRVCACGFVGDRSSVSEPPLASESGISSSAQGASLGQDAGYVRVLLVLLEGCAS